MVSEAERVLGAGDAAETEPTDHAPAATTTVKTTPAARIVVPSTVDLLMGPHADRR
jgi:hypothetical protein